MRKEETSGYKKVIMALTQEVEDLKQELEAVVADRDELQKEKDKAEYQDLVARKLA